jgi:Arc/MetJ-type ribon-helix-helix transcriptional regulator
MQKLTVTLPDEIAEMARRRVDSGEYASEIEARMNSSRAIAYEKRPHP